MNIMVWIGLAVGILVLLGIILVIFAARKKPRKTDYRAFFIMGIIWVPAAIVSMIISLLLNGIPFFFGMPILSMGLIYLVIGLANRDKWGKQVEASPTATKTMMIVFIGLVIVFIFGLVFFLFRIFS